jgi:signal transduction histidine kinase
MESGRRWDERSTSEGASLGEGPDGRLAAPASAPEAWPSEWRAAVDLCRTAWLPVCVAIGPDLELTYNEGFASLVGWQGRRWFGAPLREAWSHAWANELEPLIAHALISDSAVSRELELPSSAGRAQLSLSTLHDDLGRPTGVIAVVIMPHPSALEELHCNLLHDLVKRALSLRNVDEVHRACEKVLAAVVPEIEFSALYLSDEQLGMQRSPRSRGEHLNDLPDTIAIESPLRLDDRSLSKAVTRCWAESGRDPDELVWFPLVQPDGLLGMLLVALPTNVSSSACLDFVHAVAVPLAIVITHVKSRRDVAESARRAGAQVTVAEDFVARLSEQLRVPLAQLLREIDGLLASRSVSVEGRTQLRVARRRARRLGRLIDILLDLSRFDGHKLRPHRLPTNLASATKRLCELFRPAFQQAEIAFSVNCGALPYPAMVDREMWEKLVSNLLANALKFTLRGEVRVFQFCAAQELVLVVSDTGVGIHKADLPYIFEPYFAHRGTSTRSDEGAGIGLSLVRELVRFHGGSIHVASTFGRGSDFTVRIPFGPHAVLPAQATAEIGVTNDYTEAADTLEEMWEWTDGTAPEKASTAIRILAVEGDPWEREQLCTLLGAHWKVDFVPDGLLALESARAAVPDLIIAEVDAYGVDGVSLAKALHDDPHTADVPVILVCGRAGEQASIDGLSAGALDYIVKPISPRELIARVEARLSQARSRHQDRVAREAAEHELQVKDEVIMVVSHELRAPLAVILGWLQVLRDDGFSTGPVAKAIDVIERNAHVQARLLKDLFDASRMIAGKLEIKLQRQASLRSLVEAAVESMLPIAQNCSIELHAEIEDTTGPVLIDPGRIDQVLCNLLSNALKFTPKGGHIWVRCGMREGRVQLQVVDSGFGITPEFLPFVFERFAQDRQSRATKGLGLGLAISRYIIERHSGTIAADSRGEGAGTTITVSLPLAHSM